MKNLLLSVLSAGSVSLFGAEMIFHHNCDSRAAVPGVKEISPSIRVVPGKFGKALLVERRTKNLFEPGKVQLLKGAKLEGRQNVLSMPGGSSAVLTLETVQTKVPYFLSFKYSGGGEIEILCDGEKPASFKADKTEKTAGVKFNFAADCASVKIRSSGASTLREVMMDANIPFANTYHAPGKMRNVDRILLDPKLYNAKQGAVSFYFKSPFFHKGAEANAIVLFSVQDADKKIMRLASIWSSIFGDGHYRDGNFKKPCGSTFRMKELKSAAPGEWHHLVFNWQAKPDKKFTVSLYIDGVKYSEKTSEFVPHGRDAAEFAFGYRSGAYANGAFDELAVFSAPLTEQEIASVAGGVAKK